MNKEQWQSQYNLLDKIHSDFAFAYTDYKYGKNKMVRANAERKLDSAIDNADYYIRSNIEVYKLITGGENVTDYHRAIIYDDFKQIRHFERDMVKLLNLIRDKINSFK